MLELVNQWIVPELLKQDDVSVPLDTAPEQRLGSEDNDGSGSSDGGEVKNVFAIGSTVVASATSNIDRNDPPADPAAADSVLDLDQEKEKPCSWARIGAAIGRTGPQCRMRYHLSLDPRLKWRLWTDVEDDQLLGLRARGYNWAMVSKES